MRLNSQLVNVLFDVTYPFLAVVGCIIGIQRVELEGCGSTPVDFQIVLQSIG